MEPTQFISDTIAAIATHYAQSGIEVTVEKAKEIAKRFYEQHPDLSTQIDIDEMTQNIQTTASRVGRTAYDEETLARFLEIPVHDLATLNPDTVDMDTLYNHVKLEGEFKDWLIEWGYEVELGCTLVGLKGVEYIPDVYGKLNSLHGQFEICINFVCDPPPPDEDRVFALLQKIKTYAEAKKSFSQGDIFAVVTPHRYTPAAINAIGLQNEQEAYSVFPLDGGDIHVLESARSPKDRLDELYDKVKQAIEEARRSKINKTGRDMGEYS